MNINIVKKLGIVRWLVLAPVTVAVLVACGGGGGGSSKLTGVAVDGYLVGATVFVDLNGNGQLDAGEPNTTTDDTGHYVLDTSGVSGLGGKKIFVTGGVDSDTDKPFDGYLTAHVDTAASGQVVTPLTALVDAMVDAGLAADVEAARELIATALGLDPADLTVDPLALLDSKPGIYATETALQRSIELLASANALPEEASDRAAQQRVIKALALAVKAQESHVSLGALMSAIHSQNHTDAAAEFADAVQGGVLAALADTNHDRGRQTAREVLKALDEVRKRAKASGDFNLHKHAADLDREHGGSKATDTLNGGKGNGKK